jgi:hypothetical protein
MNAFFIRVERSHPLLKGRGKNTVAEVLSSSQISSQSE